MALVLSRASLDKRLTKYRRFVHNTNVETRSLSEPLKNLPLALIQQDLILRA